MRVIWSPSALREVARIFDYLVDFNPRAAEKVAATLIETGESLATFPNRGRIVQGTGKREVMVTYPYIIRYRVTGDVVRILRVRHSARRPTK
jgi:addiction module RelE/StbE family toxin